MQTKTRSEPTGSQASAALSESIRIGADTVAVGQTPSQKRRNPASTLVARLLSALRGDKYMVGAYPPGEER